MNGRSSEIIVVGAGPAGSATAAHLAQDGRQVLLIDRSEFPRSKPCAEYASPETEQVLKRLGVWSSIQGTIGQRLQGMIIVSPSGRRFPSEYFDGGARRHSLALPRRELDETLRQHAIRSGAECRLGLQVEAPLFEDQRVRGIVARNRQGEAEELRAELVVGADGLRSRLARRLGGARPAPWPRRLGLAAHYRGLDGATDWGEMYVGRSGYCGLAPLDAETTTVAAAVPLGRSRTGGPEAQIAAVLRDHPTLLARLGRAERLEPFRGAGPLAWRVPRVAGPGFLLVGDAAGFFDPFTGEGIFRALRGAELAGEVIGELGREPDWIALERRYRELRHAAFAGKERLAWLIQLFISRPPLLDYALSRLERRPALAERLSAALGDFGPPAAPLHPLYLGRLLRP
jgi:geranylgeranyl reductase family protein